MPEVSTEHTAANDLISGLREIAVGVKQLGDENMRLEGTLDSVRYERDAASGAQEELGRWSELLEDFRLGIRDRDELFKETVGRT